MPLFIIGILDDLFEANFSATITNYIIDHWLGLKLSDFVKMLHTYLLLFIWNLA